MKQIHKRYKGWCDNCDRNIVAAGTKCGVCGVRAISIKKKKLNTNKILEFFDKDKI